MKTAKEFCELLNLEEEITGDLVTLEKKVSAFLGDAVLLLAKETLKDGITNEEYQKLLKDAQAYGSQIGEHEFRMQMVFAYYCFALLEEKYELAGISKELYNETMQDFKWRVYECREVYHFNGIFVAWWYWIFCNLSLHKIDTMEFEKTVADFDYDGKGASVRKGDPIIAIHIPPKFKMSRQTVKEALRRSYQHYGFCGKVAYQCDSWLLYPDFEEIFVKGGNVAEFRTFFDVIRTTDHPTFEDCWRVFKVGEITDLSVLPTDTRLQRNMLQHLRSGGKTGDGFGILVFDGENIL